MASLLMADDLFEIRRRLQDAETALAAVQAGKPDPVLARKLNRAAQRAEEIADGLEAP